MKGMTSPPGDLSLTMESLEVHRNVSARAIPQPKVEEDGVGCRWMAQLLAPASPCSVKGGDRVASERGPVAAQKVRRGLAGFGGGGKEGRKGSCGMWCGVVWCVMCDVCWWALGGECSVSSE